MKGSFYVMEASIAVVMMILTLVFFFQNPKQSMDMTKANYKLKIYDALDMIEQTGNLRKDTLNNNATGIESDLSSYIASYLRYNVTIYNKTSNITALPTIDSESIITVSYFVAGKTGNYTPREVRVFAWGFD